MGSLKESFLPFKLSQADVYLNRLTSAVGNILKLLFNNQDKL